jgi:hypothetical protein
VLNEVANRGLQTFVEWVHLVLNLQFGRYVSFHKHSLKGIIAIPSMFTNIVHPMFWVLGSQTINYFEFILGSQTINYFKFI